VIATFTGASEDVEFMGNPVVAAVVAGGIAVAGLIVGAVQARKARKSQEAQAAKIAAAQTAAAAASEKLTKSKTAQTGVIGAAAAALGLPLLFLFMRGE
jgi:hypothetical protein